MKKTLLLIHHKIEKAFVYLVKAVIVISGILFGISSWVYPVFNIWTDVIDKEFSLLKSIIYILIGIMLFYIASAINRLKDADEDKER